MSRAQTQVHHAVRKGGIRGRGAAHAGGPGIDQQRFFRIQAEAADIVLLYVMMETVDLDRIDGIKFVNLDKTQLVHAGITAWINAVLFQVCLRFGILPSLQIVADPFDEMFGRLAGWQRNSAIRVILHPFQKSQSRQFSQSREIAHLNNRDFLYRRVDELAAGLLQRDLLDIGRGYDFVLTHKNSKPFLLQI